MHLREVRKERGLTLVVLGDMSDVDTGTISRIERGLADPRISTVVKLSKALDLTVDEVSQLVSREGKQTD